jgi:hypothetical protein
MAPSQVVATLMHGMDQVGIRRAGLLLNWTA